MYMFEVIIMSVLATIIGICAGMSVNPKNKVHFYVARDKNGKLWLYMGKPIRFNNAFIADLSKGNTLTSINFRCFGLNENDYANLRFEDEPVEVFLSLEN